MASSSTFKDSPSAAIADPTRLAGQRVVIIGAGLVGCLMACYLRRMGAGVTLYDRRPDPRAAGYAGGRSINLALSVRGLRGLAGVGGGLAEQVMGQDALPMAGRIVHAVGAPGVSGPTVFQPYSSNPADAINSVSRGGLNITLINAAQRAGAEFVFDHACLDLDPDTATCLLQQTGSSAATSVRAEFVLGCDGAFSPVRLRMQKTDRFEYSQTYLEHGYKELHIPPTASGEFAMDPRGLHIWPRGGAMMIALPNRDRSFTCTLFWPFEGPHGFANLKTPEQVRAFFEAQYPDAVPLMPTLVEDFQKNPTSSLVTVRCWPWVWKDRVCMLGDAAHAIVPFYGQGMNCGFEDCLELAERLAAHPHDRARAFDEFQHARKPNADAIAKMALANFVEMRDTVGSPAFRERKRVEQALHRAFPDRCEPQYNLVSFSTVPYVEAREKGRALDRVLDRVVAALRAEHVEAESDEAWRARVERIGRSVLGADERVGGGLGVIDLSPVLTPDINVWPGDTPLTREVLLEISRGAPVTLSTMRTTMHLGSHADGPNHYVDQVNGRPAPGVGEWDVERFLGPCHVVWADVPRGTRVAPAQLRMGDLRGEAVLQRLRHPRVLVRTGTFPDHRAWNSDFAAFSVELIDALATRGVLTVGLDSPSVDLQDSKDLPAHKAIARHGMAILEGLVLGPVAAGEYELIALPLRLVGFDGSPVRAVLRPMT